MVKQIIREFIIMEIMKNVVDGAEIRNTYVRLILVAFIYEDELITAFFIFRCCQKQPNDGDGIISVISVCGPFLGVIRRFSLGDYIIK